jgi:L-threonylcarbamoyladenylate synthase
MASLPDSSADAIAEAARVLTLGGLVAFPTETVYGLGAAADDPAAVARVFKVKGRPTAHPLIVHVADAAAFVDLTPEVSEAAARLAEKFWPGPLTLVVPRGAAVLPSVTGGQDTVAVRVPAHPVALALLRAYGRPIAAPSANRFGAVSPTTAEHVRTELGGAVDLVLDGGACAVGLESTIIDLTGSSPLVLRPGGVPVEALSEALGEVVRVGAREAVRAPGGLPSHYAPDARVILCEPDAVDARVAELTGLGARVAVLAPDEVPIPAAARASVAVADPSAYARALYAALRHFDAKGSDVVRAAPPPASGLGRAIVDRLSRAAAPRPESD